MAASPAVQVSTAAAEIADASPEPVVRDVQPPWPWRRDVRDGVFRAGGHSIRVRLPIMGSRTRAWDSWNYPWHRVKISRKRWHVRSEAGGCYLFVGASRGGWGPSNMARAHARHCTRCTVGPHTTRARARARAARARARARRPRPRPAHARAVHARTRARRRRAPRALARARACALHASGHTRQDPSSPFSLSHRVIIPAPADDSGPPPGQFAQASQTDAHPGEARTQRQRGPPGGSAVRQRTCWSGTTPRSACHARLETGVCCAWRTRTRHAAAQAPSQTDVV